MKYSIAFKDLPFEPDERQVIYVENQYDERINAIIKDNYDWLRWTFKRTNLDFIYLPLFFNDEEIKEKVLYYAPYLTTEIMEKAELRSSFLLRYMSHIENKEKITPSFLYAPKKENDEWVFQGYFLNIDQDDRNTILQRFEGIVSEIELTVASVQRSREIRFSEDIYEGIPNRGDDVRDSQSPQVEYSSVGPALSQPTKNHNEDDEDNESNLEEIREENADGYLRSLQEIVKKLRLIGVGPATIHEAVDKVEILSRLRITDDLRLFLPDYNNLEIRLTPQLKAIYLLFLYHHKGIILKHLDEYRDDLVSFYKKTKGRKKLSPEIIESVKNLVEYDNNNINTIMSKIRYAFESRFDKHLAKHYVITGKAGEPYKIPLSQDLIVWGDEEE